MKRNLLLILAEILVMGGIAVAFIAPLLFPSEEPSEVELSQKNQVAISVQQMGRNQYTKCI